MATNFQKHLDNVYRQRQTEWKSELKNLDLAGDFKVADAENFLASVTSKSTANWAVGVELKTRHGALKKIIDSL